jgi:hypothetical protein
MRRVLVAALVVGMAGLASADDDTKHESGRLFEEGRALAKDGKYDKACHAFARSLELDRAPGTLLNYADCHEHLGHLAQAWRLFDEAARASEQEGNEERAKFARERAQALVPKTSTIVVRLATPDAPGLTISIAGRTAQPAAEVREVVDPGDVTIEVAAPEMQPFEKRERAEAGLKLVVEVPALTPVVHEPATVTRRRHTRVVAAYTLGGLGGASLLTGVVVGVMARSAYNDQFDNGRCINNSPPLCDSEGYKAQRDAITRANIGTVFALGGLALLGAGAVVFVTAPKDVVVIPTASAEAGGLAVVGRF